MEVMDSLLHPDFAKYCEDKPLDRGRTKGANPSIGCSIIIELLLPFSNRVEWGEPMTLAVLLSDRLPFSLSPVNDFLRTLV